MAGPPEPPRLALAGIGKSFPGVRANDDISFSVASGKIHALIGENGAGKSTLVKIIYGVQQADEGDIFWQGERVSIPNPKAARKLGIGMVFQHFSLFEPMTVIENIALGFDHAIDRKELERQVEKVLSAYSIPLDPHRAVHTLSVGERQRIEIVRCLLQNPKLLIMDEPTSVLTPQEAERLFDTLRQLAREGCSILYISHKLGEIKTLCDSATILRGGKKVAECDPKIETTRRMAELMIGAELKTVTRAERAASAEAKPRFAVNNLSQTAESHFGASLKNISLSVKSGEIFGVAGVAGNGQGELLLALSGEIPCAPSTITLDGKPIGDLGPDQRRKLGLCAVPEERNGHAAVPDLSLAENTVLTARQRIGLVASGFIGAGKTESYTAKIIERFGVKANGFSALARSLSGGNLQKFIMGREILQTPDVLVVSQPTWGVDAGAAAAIHQALVDLATRGSAILVISQDLDELLTLCDRIAVINEGRLSRALDVSGVSIDELGLLMGGVHGEHAGDPPTEAAHAAA
ncbi:ABC transporter ATP-binding protein [Terrarubrum flagellatum]|uniref:ABC transporter ATP-binding protein n=1 Tax=Terrirubrum flagellatum TaxID=2895980 RepID=UPI003145443B